MGTITLAGGCFWCTEAIFQRLRGVSKVTSGYANSEMDNPSYESVHLNDTSAVEAIQIEYDPETIPLEELLEVFWATHDPTTLNQQGYDMGTEYRSGIYYQTEDQKRIAERSKQEASKGFEDPIVTEVLPLKNFYPAEKMHQDFYNNRKSPVYCTLVIDPKVQKLLKEFSGMVKEEYRS